MTTGENMKAVRLTSGMAQFDLAKRTHIAPDAIRDYETDKRPVPPDVLRAVSEELGCPEGMLADPDGLARHPGGDESIEADAARLEAACGLDPRAAMTALSVLRVVSGPDPADPGKTCYVPPMLANSADWKSARAGLRFLASFQSLHAPSGGTLADDVASRGFANAANAAADMQGFGRFDVDVRARLVLLAKYYWIHRSAVTPGMKPSEAERAIRDRLDRASDLHMSGLFPSCPDEDAMDAALYSIRLAGPDDGENDAGVFLHGHCAVFALALRDLYGYAMFVAPDDGYDPGEDPDGTGALDWMAHCFCVAEAPDGTAVRIDVRGATDDAGSFFGPFEDFTTQPGTPCIPVDRDGAEAWLRNLMGPAFNIWYARAAALVASRPGWYGTWAGKEAAE